MRAFTIALDFEENRIGFGKKLNFEETGAKIYGFDPIEPLPLLDGDESIESKDFKNENKKPFIKLMGLLCVLMTLVVAAYIMYCYCGRRLKKIKNQKM